jgi:chaperonin GroES
MRREPLYDRIIVKIIEPNQRTGGGLWIPDMALDGTPYLTAEVVAVGHGRITSKGDTVPLIVVAGDVVTFFRMASSGEQLVIPGTDDGEQMIIREAHVAYILRDLDRVSALTGADGRPMVLQ